MLVQGGMDGLGIWEDGWGSAYGQRVGKWVLGAWFWMADGLRGEVGREAGVRHLLSPGGFARIIEKRGGFAKVDPLALS